MLVPTETRVTPWRPFGHYGATHVRIWARQTPHGLFQRHEWRCEDGSSRKEGWIVSGRQWPTGAVATNEDPPAPEAMLAALRLIRDGHNDPRAVACETLQSIEGL